VSWESAFVSQDVSSAVVVAGEPKRSVPNLLEVGSKDCVSSDSPSENELVS
jgi:hypothetical protein